MYAAKKAGVKVRISESLSMAAPGEWKTYVKYMLRPLSHLYATHYMACGEDCGIFQFGKKAFDEGKIAIFKRLSILSLILISQNFVTRPARSLVGRIKWYMALSEDLSIRRILCS